MPIVKEIKRATLDEAPHLCLDRPWRGLFVAPAYPLKKVVDPTGAGDSFVGGLMGHLASQKGSIEKNLRTAIIHGTVTASCCCEDFGLKKTTKVKNPDLTKRARELRKMIEW